MTHMMLKKITSLLDRHGTPHNASSSLDTGHYAENVAQQFLLTKGMNLLCQHYRCKMGEIDLIMQDKNEIVFVEVRYRRNTFFGEPFETVDKQKQQRLIRTALFFQQKHRWTEAFTLRFDVISIAGKKLNSQITWIPNAFGVE